MPLHSRFIAMLPPVPFNKKGPVFKQITKAHLINVLHDACRKAGLPPVGTHEFGRHSFCQQRENSGWTNEQIAAVTNNLAAIQRYKHRPLELQRRVIENRLDDKSMIGGPVTS